MAPEPDASGGGRFSGSATSTTKGLLGRQKSKTVNFSGGFGVEIPGIKQLAGDLHGVSNALNVLKSTMQSMSSSFTAGPIVNALAQISRAAQTTQQNLGSLSATVAGVGGVRPSAGPGRFSVPSSGAGNSTSPNAGFAQQMSQNAGSYNTQAGQFGSASSGMASALGGAINGATAGMVNSIPVIGPIAGGIMNFAGDMAMMPLRFARERIQVNRNAALKMSQELTPYQWQTGMGTDDLMWSLKNIPGGMKGDVADILGALGIGRTSGAAYGFGQQGGGGRYSNRFYSNIGQFQQIAPGVGAGQMASIVGGSLQTQTNQLSAFYTGGAFSMISAGGGMKSASEWAEGIYNWLKNQRPGRDRGKDFKYGELLAQNFPGSNINAWFQTVGVSDQMRDFWWSWALAKTKMNLSGDKVFDAMGADNGKLESNQAWRRAAAVTATTRNEFGLAGQMTGQYATRERSNLWYNQAVGAAVNRIIPGMAQRSALRAVQYLPDEVENFLWNTLESSGPFAQVIGGGMLGWGSMALGMGTDTQPMGDIGDYGEMGGTSLAGLHPDMKKKVGAMMRANPRLKMSSGLRDKYTSAKLQRKGIGHFGSGVAYMGDVGDGRKTNRNGPHSGGWAADLGPRSEYAWIAKNAHKFGLSSGASKGEPWHVGMGDVGDNGFIDFVTDLGIGGLGGAIAGAFGFGPSDIIPGIGAAMNGIEMLAKVLSGVIDAFDKIKNISSGGNFLDPTGYSGSNTSAIVQKQSSEFMKLMGLNAAAGLPADQRIGYDKGYGSGLSTSISFSAGSPFGAYTPGGGGGGGGAGGGATPSAASVSRILQQYAGGNSVEAKSVDGPTKARMQVALQAAAAAGFSGDELITIVSLAGRESNFRPEAYNGNLGTGDNSYGLWQINTLNGMWDRMKGPLGLSSKDQLKDPMINARAAKYLFDQSATPFFAWGPYKDKAPLHGGAEDWVPAVYSVAKESGYVGDIGMEYQAAGGGSVRTTTLNFNNQFHIQGGTGASGLDIGRIVPIMADRLEEEMKKRMAVRH